LRFVAIIFILSGIASAGVVQTLDGKSYSGDVRLGAGDQIVITPLQGPAVKVGLSEILSAQLKEPAPVGAAEPRQQELAARRRRVHPLVPTRGGRRLRPPP